VIEDVEAEGGRPILSRMMLDSGLWCMDIAIFEGNPDRVEAKFNPRIALPFAADTFNWEWFLPG